MGRNGLLFVCTEMLYGTEICMDYMGQLWLTNSYMYVLFGIIGWEEMRSHLVKKKLVFVSAKYCLQPLNGCWFESFWLQVVALAPSFSGCCWWRLLFACVRFWIWIGWLWLGVGWEVAGCCHQLVGWLVAPAQPYSASWTGSRYSGTKCTHGLVEQFFSVYLGRISSFKLSMLLVYV